MRKDFTVRGLIYITEMGLKKTDLRVQITKDSIGSTISIDNGQIMFQVPLEQIEAALKEE